MRANQVPNHCFGYRIKLIKVTSPGTEIVRISNSLYKQFMEQSVALKFSEKEMSITLDTEL
jgi:hypothetical protein